MSDTKSRLYWPNAFAHILLQAIERAIGKDDLSILMTFAGLEHYIEHYPPLDLVKAVDFGDITALRFALNRLYGTRGGQVLALHIGRLMYIYIVGHFVHPVALVEEFIVPPNLVAGSVVPGLAGVLSRFSDQVSRARDEGDHLVFTLEQCPFCWRQTAEKPMCQIVQGIVANGLTKASRKYVSGDRIGRYHFRVQIATCLAMGDDMGRLIVYKMPVDIFD
jgi:hypothetical protein